MTETRQEFHAELEAISNDLVDMAGTVIDAVNRSTMVLRELDLVAARAVIDGDDTIDATALDLEERCARLFALQAPLASDLRGVLVALWMIGEIERCGDLAANLAKAARRLYHSRIPDGLQALLPRMGTEAISLLRLAVDAYAARDASIAAALDDFDDRLDALHRRWLATLFESHREGGVEVEAGVQLALVGRYYERIGDHAVNIGQRVVYLVTGWLPEHTGAARIELRRHMDDAGGPKPLGQPGDSGSASPHRSHLNTPPPVGLGGQDDTVAFDGADPADPPDEEQ